MTTKAIVPVLQVIKEEQLKQVNVSIIEGKEVALIASVDTEKYLNLVMEISDEKNTTKRQIVEDALKNTLKATCNATVAKWSNLVQKIANTPKYRDTHTSAQVEVILKDNPKVKWMYAAAVQAANIKKNL